MPPSPSCPETVASLTFALGGLENIISVENCLSRLRIFTKEAPPADDREFLGLGFMGVVRLKKGIHLICGTKAIALRHVFQCLLDAAKDTPSLTFLAHAGGQGNVSQLISSPGKVGLRLSSPVEFPLIEGLSITRQGSTVFASQEHVPAELFAIHLQSALMFWDFLYALNLYRLFSPFGIKNISACRTRLRLKLDTLKNLPLPYPPLALGLLPIQEEAGEVHLPCPSRAEPCAALMKRFAALYGKKTK